MLWHGIASSINYLNLLLTLSGIQPVHDQRQNGSKYCKFGILCIVIHTVLCVYCDHKMEEEQAVLRMFLTGIMFGMSYLKRISSLVYPVAIVLGAILQFESLATFMELKDHLDVFLHKCSLDVVGMHKKIKEKQLLSTVMSLLMALLTGISTVYYTRIFFRVGFAQVYSGVFFSLNYTLVTFKICNNFYALYLRTELYCEHLKRIVERQRRFDVPVKKF